MNALNAATSQIDNGMQGEIRYVSHKAHSMIRFMINFCNFNLFSPYYIKESRYFWNGWYKTP